MKESSESRRRFLKAAGLTAAAVLLPSGSAGAKSSISTQRDDSPTASSESALRGLHAAHQSVPDRDRS